MHLIGSGYPGAVLEGSGKPPPTSGTPPDLPLSPGDRPAIVDFLQGQAASESRRLSILLRLEAARISSGHMASGDAFAEARSRVLTAARIQSCLARQIVLEQVLVADYLDELCDEMAGTLGGPGKPTLTCQASGPTLLPAPTAIWLGLIASELIVLAFRYGFRAGRGGRVHVAFSAASDAHELLVEDSGRATHTEHGERAACLAVVRALAAHIGARLVVADVICGKRVIVTLARH